MARRISVLFLLSFLLLAFVGASNTFGAKSDFEAKSNGPRYVPAAMPWYLKADGVDDDMTLSKTVSKIALNSNLNGKVFGSTYYDWQSNNSQQRQIEHRGANWLHAIWMYSSVADIADENRDVNWGAYKLSDCQLQSPAAGFGLGSGERSGYGALDVYPGIWPVIAAHTALGDTNTVDPNADITHHPAIFSDFGYKSPAVTSPVGVFDFDYPIDVMGKGHDSVGIAGFANVNIWPKIEFQNGTEQVIHMVCAEYLATMGTSSYYRRVGEYGFDNTTGLPLGVWSDQQVVDTIGWGDARPVASPTSDKVAIVWQAPGSWLRGPDEHEGSWLNDVYYAIDPNQGAGFIAISNDSSICASMEAGDFDGGNISNYPGPDCEEDSCYRGMETAFNETQGMWDSDGFLHIVWTTRISASVGGVTWRDGAIWHWSEDNSTPRLVYRPPAYGLSDQATCGSIDYNAKNAGLISLAECTGGPEPGNIYISFTRFGTDANPCGDVDKRSTPGQGKGNLSGYLYYVASPDAGFNWDRPQQITDNLMTPDGCYPDTNDPSLECHTESFGTLARYSRPMYSCEALAAGDSTEVMDILYIDDAAPGGIVGQPAARRVYTNNPIVWQTVPCRVVVPEPIWSDSYTGEGIGQCYSPYPLYVLPGEDTSFTFIATNPGLAPNTWSVNVPGSPAWVNVNPTGGTILCCGADTVEITITLSGPVGAPDPSTHYATIHFDNQDTYNSQREILACLVVTTDYNIPDSATLATDCKKIMVWSDGRLGNNFTDASMTYDDDCDTFGQHNAMVYLYDASPVFAWVDGAETKLSTSCFSNAYLEERTLRPLEDLTIDNSNAAFIKATGEFTTFDSTINCTVEYYIPQGVGDSCEFIIQRLYVTSAGSSKGGVLIGEWFDWDVPSDSASDNTSGVDEDRQLIWQQGEEADDDHESGHADSCNFTDESVRFGAVKILQPKKAKNAQTLDNATWVYTGGRFEDLTPIPTVAVYDIMLNGSSFSRFEQTDPAPPDTLDSTYTDLSMFITYGEYDLTNSAPKIITIALITTRDASDSTRVQELADLAAVWADLYGLVPLSCCIAGDANGDTRVNLGDALTIINYVFKGGDAPDCTESGDANGDGRVNLGDALTIINYVFKGGDAPKCPE